MFGLHFITQEEKPVFKKHLLEHMLNIFAAANLCNFVKLAIDLNRFYTPLE